MITNGASAFGRLAAGIGADKFGTYNVAIVGLSVMVVLMFAWLAMNTAGPLIALCCLYGFASGAPVSLQGPMVTASATDPRQAGTLIGQALSKYAGERLGFEEEEPDRRRRARSRHEGGREDG